MEINFYNKHSRASEALTREMSLARELGEFNEWIMILRLQ